MNNLWPWHLCVEREETLLEAEIQQAWVESSSTDGWLAWDSLRGCWKFRTKDTSRAYELMGNDASGRSLATVAKEAWPLELALGGLVH